MAKEESCFWCDVNDLVRAAVRRTYLAGFTDGHESDGASFTEAGEIETAKVEEWMGEVLVDALGIVDHKEKE